jgi:hypothetical protein
MRENNADLAEGRTDLGQAHEAFGARMTFRKFGSQRTDFMNDHVSFAPAINRSKL